MFPFIMEAGILPIRISILVQPPDDNLPVSLEYIDLFACCIVCRILSSLQINNITIHSSEHGLIRIKAQLFQLFAESGNTVIQRNIRFDLNLLISASAHCQLLVAACYDGRMSFRYICNPFRSFRIKLRAFQIRPYSFSQIHAKILKLFLDPYDILSLETQDSRDNILSQSADGTQVIRRKLYAVIDYPEQILLFEKSLHIQILVTGIGHKIRHFCCNTGSFHQIQGMITEFSGRTAELDQAAQFLLFRLVQYLFCVHRDAVQEE